MEGYSLKKMALKHPVQQIDQEKYSQGGEDLD